MWNLDDETLVLDPDGWDRSNFRYSWFEEKISYEEYLKRRSRSTVTRKSDMEHYRIAALFAELEHLYVNLDEKHEAVFKTALRKLNATFGVADVNHHKHLMDWVKSQGIEI